MAKKKKNNISKYFIAIIVVVVLSVWYIFFISNTAFDKNSMRLNIKTGSTLDSVLNNLSTHHMISNIQTFKWVAQQLGYSHIYEGSYVIKHGMSNLDILHMLKSGKQTPVSLVIIKARTINELSAFLGKQFEADSALFNQTLSDSTILSKYHTTKTQVIGIFIPNTYLLYWNTSPENILKRISNYHHRFWDKNRLAMCDSINLKPSQVEILASIIDEETYHPDEKPILAGIYINRLHKDMPLQADPTARYAVGDFTLTQILNTHIQYKSPYNTYIHKGLPPGPICTPSTEGIEAVLNYNHSNYLYFCAKPGGSGYHSYANTYDEHIKNAHAYQQYEKMLHHKS